MNLDPTKDELLQWVKDMEALSKRTDLTQEQKVALAAEKIRKYKEDLRVLLDAEEKRREELRKTMSPYERDLDESRWSFYRKWREGKVFVRPFPKSDDQADTDSKS